MGRIPKLAYMRWDKPSNDDEYLMAAKNIEDIAPDALNAPATVGVYRLVRTIRISKQVKVVD